MDDVTPLQQLTPEVLASDAHLFQPRPAYRFMNRQGTQSQPSDPGAGQNPTYGASLSFFLQEVPAAGVTLEVLDTEGVRVRLLSAEELVAGINRVHWNLREASSQSPRLRTEPSEHSHVDMPDSGSRSLGEGGTVTPLAPPGTYTVRLEVGDLELTQWHRHKSGANCWCHPHAVRQPGPPHSAIVPRRLGDRDRAGHHGRCSHSGSKS